MKHYANLSLGRLAMPALLSIALAACGGGEQGESSSASISSSSVAEVSSSVSSESSVASSESSIAESSSSESSSVASSTPAPANEDPIGYDASDPSYGGNGIASGLPFPFGIAVPDNRDAGNYLLSSADRQSAVTNDFSQITFENAMKMNYEVEKAQPILDWASQNGIGVHGHALIWHPSYQLPSWAMNPSDSQFQENFRQHIRDRISVFQGRVTSWDVVNEAIGDVNDDAEAGVAPDGYRDSVFYQAWNGPGYIEEAFRIARETDPDVLLYYNDFNTEENLEKTDTLVEMITDFVERGVPIDGVGFQMHVLPDWADIKDIRESLQRIVNISPDLLIKITELDVRLSNPYAAEPSIVNCNPECPDALLAQKQRYQEIIQAYLDIVPPRQRGGITIWGITDNDSWFYDQDGYYDYPLLFDSAVQPKPAYDGVKEILSTIQ